MRHYRLPGPSLIISALSLWLRRPVLRPGSRTRACRRPLLRRRPVWWPAVIRRPVITRRPLIAGAGHWPAGAARLHRLDARPAIIRWTAIIGWPVIVRWPLIAGASHWPAGPSRLNRLNRRAAIIRWPIAGRAA